MLWVMIELLFWDRVGLWSVIVRRSCLGETRLLEHCIINDIERLTSRKYKPDMSVVGRASHFDNLRAKQYYEAIRI